MPILGLLRRRPVAVEEVEEVREPAPVPAGPPLVLLAPTVAGVGCFHMVSFGDAASAAVFAEDSFTRFQRSNIYAFWALHHNPGAGSDGKQARGEVLVLIREAEGSSTVYAVSFVDFEAADAFVRFESKRGLNLALVSIHWAALIEVEETSRGVLLRPETPPQPEGAHNEAPARPQRYVSDLERFAAQEAERTPSAPLRKEVRAEVEAVLEAYHPAEAPTMPPPPAQSHPVQAEPEAAPVPEPVTQPRVEDVIAEPVVEPLPRPRIEEIVVTPPRVVRQRVEEPCPAVEEDQEPVPGIVAAGGEAPVVPEQVLAQETSTVVDVREAEETDEEPLDDEPAPDLFDVALEAAKTLRFKRWQQHEEPFHGFNSPPGRF